ncbi:MAG: endopeptidase La [Candidatus Sumerlaeia bacterium]
MTQKEDAFGINLQEITGRVRMPVLPVRNTVLFPGQVIPIAIGRPVSVMALKRSVEHNNSIVGIVTQKEKETENPTSDDLYKVGSLARVLRSTMVADGTYAAMVQGLARFEALAWSQMDPFIEADVHLLQENTQLDETGEKLFIQLKREARRFFERTQRNNVELDSTINSIDKPNLLCDFLAGTLDIETREKQTLLEELSVQNRLYQLIQIIKREMQLLELSEKIDQEVRKGIEKNQREYYLREQMRAIQDELGEGDEQQAEIAELEQRIKKAKMPPEVEKEAMRELGRLRRIPPAAAEYTVARTYLEWLIELPWKVQSKDRLEIAEAQKVLDEDHYNLEKVKKRILEFLAVRKLRKDPKGPILCFVGPPGVGKTSLGRSIARAMGRKFVRVSLGGVRDEAEIRGHRRTYVGALPGRIIQEIRKAGVNNPVFMLDEVDKLGADFRGDPSSALLEVLDPEQNNSFTDHYLDVPFDLSKVFFICTANVLDTIPPALRDRMETIEIPGYTEEDKLFIASRYLVPRQLQENGLNKSHLTFTTDGLKEIIRHYTKEAGVRNLERQIAAVCRAVARDVAEGKEARRRLTAGKVFDYLGPHQFEYERGERTSIPGVAIGLAWTPTGGDILYIEATRMAGKGELRLTGQLGDVMKESAEAARSSIRANARLLGIDPDIFTKEDIHIHVPAGAIPKDGPSAGVTIYAALLSLFTGHKVRDDVAMTGELTLRGLVLPVGGIKEKVLAARRAGIFKIILPARNEKDLVDIREEELKGMEFFFIHRVDEIPKIIFAQPGKEKRGKTFGGKAGGRKSSRQSETVQPPAS